MNLRPVPLLVVGAGLMGTGIVQVAALAGHAVALHDTRPGAAAAARERVSATLDGLVAKGRLEATAAAAALARIRPLERLDEAGALGIGLVVEAVVEDLAAKRALFAELAALLGEGAVLATNTSSISVTAIAAGVPAPGRVVGMHFFNPVPLMKLVEVVSGLQTDPAVAAAVFDLARAWGKVPVHAKSTPGFVVNRIARPYYAETWALLLEQAAAPEVIDACLRGAGFRMGPCELMDLIGHDTNLAVTRSVFEANFGDARYRPSLLQAEMVAGGLLGRKSGRGFYAYPAGAAALPAPDTTPPDDDAPAVLHGRGPLVDALARALETAGRPLPRETDSPWCGLSVVDARLVLTDGPTAATLAARVAVADLAVFDRFDPALGPAPGQSLPLAWAAAPRCSGRWLQQAPRWLALLGFAPQRVADTPGLVVARALAMLVNEASDAVAQGVCSRDGADAAMKLGVNWPRGPFEWLAAWDADEAAAAAGVVALLRALDDTHRGERYRVNAELRRLAGG